MKTAASLLRQKTSCCVRSSWKKSVTRRSSLDEVEVDVLERRPAHLERLELAALRRPRAAVSSASARVGSSVSTTTSWPFVAVADLDLRRVADQLPRRADADDAGPR